MAYLFNLAYLGLVLVLSPWLVYQAWSKGKYREGWQAKLLGQVPLRRSRQYCVWLHAVSVGEVNLLVPLVQELKARKPDWECVISTTTQTGHEVALKKFPELQVFYAPLDFSWGVRRAMRRIRPNQLVLAELELWPNLIRAARRWGARVSVVNARLSERSFRGYRRLKRLIAWLLGHVDLVAAQNDMYAARFDQLGSPAGTVFITGSVKYDGARTDRQNPATCALRRLAGIADNDPVFLAGSTQEGEEAAALATFRTLHEQHPQLKLILVPRHPERFETVARLLEASGLPFDRRSQLSESEPGQTRILLVDALGELSAWWGTATVAFVGGSFGNRGGQNMIEPAAYGAAVSFGPNTKNFRDIVASLLAADAAVVVHTPGELTDFVAQCLTDPSYGAALGERAAQHVATQMGATARTVDLLVDLGRGSLGSAASVRHAKVGAPHAWKSRASAPHRSNR